MKFCGNCGTRLDDHARFCPECGADLTGMGREMEQRDEFVQEDAFYETPAEERPGRKKKSGGIIAAVLAVLAAAAVLAIFLPKLLVPDNVRFLRANAAVLEEAVKPLEAAQEKAAEGISTDITIRGSSAQLPKDVQKILDDSALVLKIDTTGNALLMNTVLNVSGTDLFGANFSYEGETAALSMPELTNKCYTMNVPKFLKNNGVDMDLSSEDIKKLSDTKEFKEKEVKRYGTLLASAINKNNLKVEKKEIQFGKLNGGGTYKVYTWHPSPEELEKLCSDIADEIERDSDLKQRIEEMIRIGYFMEETGMKDADEVIMQMSKACRDAAEKAGKLDADDIPEWITAVDGDETRMIRIVADGKAVLTYENSGNNGAGEESVFVTDDSEDYELYRCSTEKSGKKRGFLGVEDELTVEFEMVNGENTILGLPVGRYTISAGRQTYAEIEVNSDGKITNYALSVLGGVADVNFTASGKGTAIKPEGKTVDITDYDEKELTELVVELGEEIAGNENLVELFQSLGGMDL